MAFHRTTKDEHTFEALNDTPSAITATQYVRGNAGGTDLEFRTDAEVLADIGAGVGTLTGITPDADDATAGVQITAAGTTLFTGGDGITTDLTATSTSGFTVSTALDLTSDNVWTGQQKTALEAVSNISGVTTFALDSFQNFSSTPGVLTAITFSGLSGSAGQSGFIKLYNAAAYVHTLAGSGSTVFAEADFISNVGAAGTFLISYLCDGTNVYLTASPALV